MKTYRIITNGMKFRVQRKGWFSNWHTEGYRGGPYEFDTWGGARDFIANRNVKIIGSDPDAVGERETWQVAG